jgi:hypothetical protein
MRWTFQLFLVCTIGCLLLGCSSTPKSQNEEELNRLWRAGYGFNNPNADRIRQGKEPVDFLGPKPK